jgi:Ca2+/Na+ antiporter
MSRFQTKVYREVLEDPTKRYRLRRKEKPLWKFRPTFDINHLVLLVFLLTFVLIFLSGSLSIISAKNSAILFIVWLVLFFVFLIYAGNAVERKIKNNLQKKKPHTLQQFISSSPVVQKYKKNYIRAIRYTLGFAYRLNPDIIYTTDTPQSLGSITRRKIPPLSFEVVLGASNRLGIILSDEEIDRIGEQIYKNTRCVEELFVTLSEELSSAAQALANESESFNSQSITTTPKQQPPADHATADTAVESISLNDLRELADKTPAKRYINCCIIDMAHQGPAQLIFTESEPIRPRSDFDPAEMPSFAEILNRCKKMAGLGPALYQTPQHKVLELVVGLGTDSEKKIDAHFEICDGAEQVYVKLQVEPHNIND